MSRQLCRNCGHEVDGNYCPACGQRTSTHRLSWATLVESFASTFIGDEAYGVRGMNMRRGLVGTWWTIVVRPSRSIGEFIAGHRRKYFNPVAVLLLLSTLYAALSVWAGKEVESAVDPSLPPLRQAVRAVLDYVRIHPAASALVSLPFAALAMKTLFGRKCDLHYVEYLYVGIFLSVFEVTLMVVQLPLELLVPRYSSFYGNTLPVFVYTAAVFWRLFGLTKKGALLRTLAVDALTYLYAIVTVVAGSLLLLGGVYLVSPESFEGYGREPRQETIGATILGAFGEAVTGLLNSALGTDDEPSEEPAPGQIGEASGTAAGAGTGREGGSGEEDE